MAQLPRKPRAGSRWEEQRASEWSTLIDEVKRLRDEVNAFKNGDARNTPALRYTVLIVREPKANDKVLKVKRVVYKDFPPRDCNPNCHYAFEGPEFEAFPDIGVENIEDYSDVWDATKSLDAEQPYQKAYWERDRWFVEKPAVAAAEIDYCVILQTSGAGSPSGVSPANDPTLGAFRLRVQRVHLNDVGVWVSKGSPLVTSTRPNTPGSLYDDYRRFNRNGTFTGSPTSENWSWSAHANMVTFQVMKTDGIWICEQPPPLVTRQFPSGTAAGCSTV